MDINNNLQSTYKQYIESQKAQQKQMEASAKTAVNPDVRKYLEASSKLMGQLNQLDEVVLSTMAPKKPKGILAKIKAAFTKH